MDDLRDRHRETALLVPAATLRPGNLLLATLPRAERRRIIARCELVQLTRGDILCEHGARLSHVYFPINSMVSLFSSIDEHSRVEVELIGAAGMLGSSLVLGVHLAPGRALVQSAGSSLRLAAAQFANLLAQNPALERTLKRYLCVVVSQLTQRTACTYFHVMEARLACWLLMMRDGVNSNELYLTHEVAALTLGVRRVGITCAARALKKRKLIHYKRGKVTILDGPALEAAACTCYAASRQTYARIMRH